MSVYFVEAVAVAGDEIERLTIRHCHPQTQAPLGEASEVDVDFILSRMVDGEQFFCRETTPDRSTLGPEFKIQHAEDGTKKIIMAPDLAGRRMHEIIEVRSTGA